MESPKKDYKTQSYRTWHFWQAASELRRKIFGITKTFPHSEMRRISQMNSAARSIKQNIQEGYRRQSRLELARFLEISEGSAEELLGDLEDCIEDKLFSSEIYQDLDSLCGRTIYLLKRYRQTLIQPEPKKGPEIIVKRPSRVSPAAPAHPASPAGPVSSSPAGPDYFVHESSYVDAGAVIGKGTKIWHFSHVLGGARIGENCSLGQNVNVGSRVKIGNGVKIQNNVSVYDDVELEDFVFCGPSMVFTNVINPRCEVSRKNEYRRTLVKRGASIGANATVVCGHTIGRYAFVGAGSVVTRDLPDFALVYGNPARIQGWICRCGVKLAFSGKKAVCSACAAGYVKEKDVVREKAG
jgi:UDP-2-acetamido-3-amino-2,3-dideoxy-glucuronate N-acetyltransferase